MFERGRVIMERGVAPSLTYTPLQPETPGGKPQLLLAGEGSGER